MDIFIVRAKAFAAKAHASIGQMYGDRPYVVHLESVHQVIASIEHTRALLAAAYLHDVVEDVPSVSVQTVRAEFGDEVAELVAEVTDVSTKADGTRAERKALDREHVRTASSKGKTLKLADIICNLRAIRDLPPAFARVYVKEKALLLPALEGGDDSLLVLAKLELRVAAELFSVDLGEVV